MCSYIKLNREFLERLDDKPKATLVYLFLVKNATIFPTERRGITLQRGDVLTSLSQIMEWTGLSKQEVRTALKELREQHILNTNLTQSATQKATQNRTYVTICNYDCLDETLTDQQHTQQHSEQHELNTTLTQNAKRKEMSPYNPLKENKNNIIKNNNININTPIISKDIIAPLKSGAEKNEIFENSQNEFLDFSQTQKNQTSLNTEQKEKEKSSAKKEKETQNDFKAVLSDKHSQNDKFHENEKKAAETGLKVAKRRVFVPPTVAEISEYCTERQNGIDAESFWNFYESKGWFIGKNKMKSWKSAIVTWEKSKKNNYNNGNFTAPNYFPDSPYRMRAVIPEI